MASGGGDSKATPTTGVPTDKAKRNPFGLADPDTSHFSYSTDFESVYEPAEDSYLLMDALAMDAPALRHHLINTPCDTHRKDPSPIVFATPPPPVGSGGSGGSGGDGNASPTYECPPVCMEVGCGSGLVSAFLYRVIGSNATYYATDINPSAAQLASKTLNQQRTIATAPSAAAVTTTTTTTPAAADSKSSATVDATASSGGGGVGMGSRSDVILTDLTTALQSRMAHYVDVLVFNPPYVPSDESECLGDGISRSWAGGVDGVAVLNQLIPRLNELLSQRAVMYLVVLPDWNKPTELFARLKAGGLTQSTLICERKAGREHLQIYRLTRS